MTMGMIQLVAIGFEGNQFKGEIVPELEALREGGYVRLIDLVFILKDEDGNVATIEMSDLTDEQKIELGMDAGALIGLGAYGPAGIEAGAEAGAIAAAEGDLGMTQEDIDEIAAEIPENCSALIILFENLWSLPLKQAIINANGRLIGNWIIQPEMLVEMGAEMAEARAGA
jgi:uncharacterized membrane protein